MGTSSSRGGPTDKSKLLPSWALPGGVGAPDEPSNEPENDGENPQDAGGDTDPDSDGSPDSPGAENDSSDSGTDNGEDADAGSVGDVPQSTAPSNPMASPWSSARRALSRAASTRGSGRGERIKSAARSYVRARGGSRAAASSSKSARVAVGKLSGFLAHVGRDGLQAALRFIDLGTYIGRNAEEVFAAIADAVAPAGALVEDAAVRAAITDVLGDLYERVAEANGDLGVLDSMDRSEITAAVEHSIGACIYERWVSELGRSIERGAVSEPSAIDLERGMRDYINESVKLEIGERDPLAINWGEREGKDLIERVFQDAYSFLEST